MKFSFPRFLVFLVAATLLIPQARAEVVDIPDPNLEKAIREELQLSDRSPITQQEMLRLTHLSASQSQIADLKGLEYATNLRSLSLWGNPISDLAPLSNLTELRGLDLAGCQVSNITPLATLTKLDGLNLGWNFIEDISALANLIQLERLRLYGNPIIDWSPLDGLNLIVLERDEYCELPSPPIKERIENRTFPSVFAAFGKPTDSQVRNLTHLSHTERLALHDLTWRDPYLSLGFVDTHEGWRLAGSLEEAQAIRDNLLNLNPNILLLVGVRVRDAWIGYYPEDFPYWLRDKNGNIIKTPSGNFLLTDFTQPGLQDIIVQQAVAVAKCGLFDGIFFDWFAEDFPVLVGQGIEGPEGYYSYEIEQQAKDKILQQIRAAVREDFLIIVNTNRRKHPRRAWGVNGTFMETLRDNDQGYTREGIKKIEDTLIWSEENFRKPQINCLEGWGIPTEPPDSPNNLRWMRVFTTMSLTLSDGYVLYGMEDSHQHIWYDFWNANLGQPVGPQAQFYQNIEGLFIREFTNGWAVYNRSGEEQAITLPQVSTGISSKKQDITHLLPDLDGEIYLKVPNPADVNGDEVINILDLVQVANGFGKSTPDPNGDGIVNILDLVFVAQQFSQ